MGKRNYFLVPQDITDADVTAIKAAMNTTTAGQPVRRIYTESGRLASQPIVSAPMSEAQWTAAVKAVATVVYDTAN
ncbi:hypothetical protein phiVC8_p05 [Vibrio phage phiVC8]|uniref:Uncharacterized protein n=1 Tax=Vibrio phage phiVC8 TaxID=1076759 RepID=G3FFL4_BPVC8|nr:hypothetical protein phiVC8_p05 [Vibrio phage phiVC8]AEM62902.1 hypothetical protein phiVC8_p05 [Vibrio phage phiVC8]